jgi:hypothetical protein
VTRRSPEAKYGQRRMIVRRVRALPNAQSELFPAWFHYPFATNRTNEISLVEREHRQHAVVELAIRDLKDQALAHFPSGDFSANSAWTVIAALAHNMMRWTSVIGLPGKNRPDRPHPATTAAHSPRPPHPPRRHLDPATPRPLALARRLHSRTDPHPRTEPGHLTTPAGPTASTPAPPRPRCARRYPKTTPAAALTSQTPAPRPCHRRRDPPTRPPASRRRITAHTGRSGGFRLRSRDRARDARIRRPVLHDLIHI